MKGLKQNWKAAAIVAGVLLLAMMRVAAQQWVPAKEQAQQRQLEKAAAGAQQAGSAEQQRQHQHEHEQAAAGERDVHAQHGAVESMAPGHRTGAHMEMTALRPKNAEDEQRVEELVVTLRAAIQKYKDYRLAIEDGYQIFLPNVPQPEYHFTNYKYGFLVVFYFDVKRPTSLLYKKTATGYELVGAMYTAPRRWSEEQLNARVPLSVAQWHQHTNLCAPPADARETADWTKFGLLGSIVTKDACDAAGGKFYPKIFGWMVHVYPFEEEAERVWKH